MTTDHPASVAIVRTSSGDELSPERLEREIDEVEQLRDEFEQRHGRPLEIEPVELSLEQRLDDLEVRVATYVRRVADLLELVEADGDPLSYGAMLVQYLEEQSWATEGEHRPLVFHLKRIGAQLDAAGADSTAAMSSAYLQAFYRLDKRRPGAAPTGDPAQTSIDDFLD